MGSELSCPLNVLLLQFQVLISFFPSQAREMYWQVRSLKPLLRPLLPLRLHQLLQPAERFKIVSDFSNPCLGG